VATAVRARRATAAAYAAGFATLFLAITLWPYHRGEVWARWALAAGMLVVSVILLRILFLGVRLGAVGAVTGSGTARTALLELVAVSVGWLSVQVVCGAVNLKPEAGALTVVAHSLARLQRSNKPLRRTAEERGGGFHVSHRTLWSRWGSE
jgi:hypothetical protein